MSLIEKWTNTFNDKGFTGVTVTDLFKAFDAINHEVLIAKLYAYGFSGDGLKLIHS